MRRRNVSVRVGYALAVAVTVTALATACHQKTHAPNDKPVEAKTTSSVSSTGHASTVRQLPLARKPYPAARQLPLAPRKRVPVTQVTSVRSKGV